MYTSWLLLYILFQAGANDLRPAFGKALYAEVLVVLRESFQPCMRKANAGGIVPFIEQLKGDYCFHIGELIVFPGVGELFFLYRFHHFTIMCPLLTVGAGMEYELKARF